jgi:flagellar motor switch protein FliN/FliY
VPEEIDGAEESRTEEPAEEAAVPDPQEAATDEAPGDADDGSVHQLRPDAEEAAEAAFAADDDDWRNLHRMLDVPLSLTVELGKTEMPLSEVLRLEGGSVITIDRMPGEPIELLINGRVFARGEVVVINDTFGYRVTELVDDAGSTIEIGRDGG